MSDPNLEFYQRTRPIQEYDLHIPDVGGWFPLENRIEMERLIRDLDCHTAIEIGCMVGLSSAWLAQRLDHVWCVDRWYEPATVASNNNLVGVLEVCGLPNDFFPIFEANMRRIGVWDKITVVRGDSDKVVDLVPEVDLVYVDADHSYAGCLSDIQLYWLKARKVICGDDYDRGERKDFAVTAAVSAALPMHKTQGPFWWCVK